MMYVQGLPLDAYRDIVKRVSEDQYDGNVILHPDAHELGPYRFVEGLAAESSHGPGARRSWTGRRTHGASWRAYSDVITALFDEYPDALVYTPNGRRLLRPERVTAHRSP